MKREVGRQGKVKKKERRKKKGGETERGNEEMIRKIVTNRNRE